MSEFNKDFLADLGMDEKVVEKAETQEIREGKKIIDSGAYKAEIKELAIFKSGSGATMMKIVTHIEKENIDIVEYQNTVKKDGEPNPIGQATFKHALDAIVGDDKSTLSHKKEEIEAYAKKVEGTVVKGLSGKPFIALVREVFKEGDSYPKDNVVEAFAKVDGTNSKGEDLLEKFNKTIAENPVRIIKNKGGNANSGATTGKVKADASSVADML